MKKKLFNIQKNSGKNRKEAGFTLTEVLLVTAILVVVFAVGIVGVVSAQTSLRQKELDSKAEVIYMAVQNRLTELTAEGRTHLVDSSRSDVYEVDSYPVDAEEGKGGRSFFYVSSSSLGTGGAAGVLLPENRVEKELRDENWIIEYDPESGSVYAVFYSEKDMDYTPESFNALRIKKMRLREGAKVGYYGGDFAATLDTDGLKPQIVVRNEERLYAVLSCRTPDGRELEFRITLTDAFGNRWTKTVKRDEQRKANGSWVYELTLDKLTQGSRFKDLYPKLVPGSDITISFTAISENDLIDSESTQASANSLFDSVEGNKAIITYGRHLQNLDEASGLNRGEIQITSAEQRNNIHFDNDEDNADDWYSLYGKNAFTPVKNPSLQSYTGSCALSDSTTGTNGKIRGIIYGLQTEKGLFDTFYGHQVKDVTLSGTVITGGENAGAVIGSVQQSETFTITGCQVYLDASEGDLDEKTEKDVWIRGSRHVGGLVGYVSHDISIEDSFAATVVGTEETEYAGGLVGLAENRLSVENSYADCYIYGKTVGGLAGAAAENQATIRNSYAAGYISATAKAAGFLPITAKKMENAYAVFSYRKDASKIYATAAGGGTVTNVCYIPPSALYSAPENTGTAISYTDLSERESAAAMLGTAFSAATGGSNTFAYNLMNQGLSDYSFPKLAVLPHYGDWEANFEDETPIYYEVYEDAAQADDSYGIFGANLDTLSTGKTAIGDGYGIIYSTAPKTEVSLKYHDGKRVRETVLTPADAVPITSDGESYYLLKFPQEMVNTAYAPEDFYQEIQIDEKSYYYNPHFARTMTTDRPDHASSVVYVRSARQLYNLSLYYENYAKKTEKSVYTQGLNIDYTSYQWSQYSLQMTGVSAQEPIGTGTTRAFHAVYDGGYKTIEGVSFVNTAKGSYYAGLFGDNKGTLRNIALVSEYAGNEKTDRYLAVGSNVEGSKARAYIGAIAGRNSKTIRNCAAAGYTIKIYTYINSNSYIGGLVGYNSGTIRNCSAETPQMKLSATYASVRMAGLAGRNTGGIYSCYAISAIEVMESKQGSVTVAGFAGANSGTIRNAYCTASVITSGSASGCGFAPVGGTMKECYFLNNGTYFYVEKLLSYNMKPGDARVRAITGEDLKKLSLSGFAKAENSRYHQKTTAETGEKYPYPASVKKNDGSAVHYGNWVTEAQLGETGVFYWEHETGGTNAGYHFRYIGIKDGKGVNGSSLCTAHDDGGIVREYGYGYYVEKDKGYAANLRMQGFANAGIINDEASKAIEGQLSNFEIYAYTTGTSGDSHLYLSDNIANGTWRLTQVKGTNSVTYQFSLSPFFANAFSYDGVYANGVLQEPADKSGFGGQTQTPGQENNPYEIRSAMQLQYINWNSYNRNTSSAVITTNAAYNDKFPYLKYVSSSAQTGRWNFYWKQTHDVDRESEKFTPIGSMYYTADNQFGTAYIAYFAGAYNGQAYSIKNVEISADVDMVGLFGITAGARLEDIVMYSENNNKIEITNKSKRWYCLGGLVGFAARGNNEEAVITNCTVSGYQLLDSRNTTGGWGGASIGGLAGACNMNIEKSTVVNDIVLNFTYRYASYNNVRVGGLVGTSRGTINSVYCGGSIVSRLTQAGSNQTQYVNIWSGGIIGGIVMIEHNQLSALIGPTTGVVSLSNSYSYVEMPASGKAHIRCSQSIASIGEMQSNVFGNVTNPNINIYNCYAYEPNVRNTDDYKNRNNSRYWNGGYNLHTGDSTGRYIRLYNNGNKPYVTYEQLSADKAQATSVISLLNAAGQTAAEFDFVTVTENGAKIDGKYSYPGSDESLDGANYPFPTILRQTDTMGQKVSVHYGRWPKGGLYWLETRKTFDLLEMYDATTGTSGITVKLKASNLPQYSLIHEDGSAVLEENAVAVEESTSWNAEEAVYEVFLRGIRTGTGFIRASLNGETSDLMINITANLIPVAEPTELEVTKNEEKDISLTVKSSNGVKDFTKDVEWTVSMEDENIASAVPPVYDASKNAWTLAVKGEEAGETRLTATASYRIVMSGKDQIFTESVIVLVNVTEQKGTTE